MQNDRRDRVEGNDNVELRFGLNFECAPSGRTIHGSPKDRAAVLLRHEFGARRVWAFGSLSHEWFHEGSDVDLAVEGVAPDRIGRAWDRVSEVVGERVDLIAVEDASEALRERIVATGEVIE